MQVANKLAFVLFLALVIGSIYYLEAQKPPQLNVGDTGNSSVTAKENVSKANRYPAAKEITTPPDECSTLSRPEDPL